MVSSRLLASFKNISQTAGICGLVLGCLVLIGWQFEIPSVKSVLPGLATMKANTAIAFILVGASLWLRVNERSNRQVYFAAQACAGVAALLSLLTLGEYISGLNFGIDQLLYRDLQTAEASFPGRMSVTTAFNFALLSIALLILDTEIRRKFLPTQFLALIAGAVAGIALIGYLYGVDSLYSVGLYSSMALHTALGSALLSLGILCARAQKGFMEIAVTETVGGIILRRLMPLTIVLLIVLGWLRLRGQQAGFYDTNFGLALMVLFSAASLSVVLWVNAGRLNRVDTERKQAEEKLSESEERYKRFFENMHEIFVIQEVVTDQAGKPIDLRFLDINPAAERILGKTRKEIIGQTRSELAGRPDPEGVEIASHVASTGTLFHMVRSSPGFGRSFESFTYSLGSGMVATLSMDITERKQAEDALHESEERYRIVSELTSDYAYKDRVEPDGSIVPEWITESFMRITGYTLEETRAPDFWQRLMYPEDIPVMLQHMQKILAGVSDIAEMRILTKSGEMRWLRDFANPIWDATEGRVVSLYGGVQDVTERMRANEALKASEHRFRHLVENSGMLINLINREGVLIYVSPSSANVVGYSPEEMVGRKAVEFLHPDEVPDKERPFTQMFQRPGNVIRVERRARHKDGTWRWVEGYSTNLLDEPAVNALVFNYRDVTDRKQAEEEIRKLNDELEQRVAERTAALSQANSLLEMMLDNMPDQIYFKDAQSRFIRNSKSQARALGLNDPAEAIGKSDFDFFPHAQLSYEKEQEIIRTGKPVVDEEERVVWPDGRETWVSTTKVPLPDQAGEIIGTFGISRDITERKRSEAALQKAKLELESTNKELEAFSYSVSHDLRAPLRTIDGFSQALLEDYEKQLPEEAQGYLKRVRSGAQRMAELIDDLLNLSRVTRSLMKSVPVDLSSLAQSVLAELQRTHPERNVNFNITANLKVKGDPNLLQVVLENLLNNAWKFTSKREQAEIEFGSSDENGETIYFVRDNGAGFDMTYASKLFGAFQRLHAMTEYPGTGVGLATVQRIIHRHGGRVWAEAEVDQGATFFFTLPPLERAKASIAPQEKDSLTERVKEII